MTYTNVGNTFQARNLTPEKRERFIEHCRMSVRHCWLISERISVKKGSLGMETKDCLSRFHITLQVTPLRAYGNTASSRAAHGRRYYADAGRVRRTTSSVGFLGVHSAPTDDKNP